jgi:hypothetical protein
MKANLLAVLLVLVSTLAHTVNAAPYAPYPSYYPAVAAQRIPHKPELFWKRKWHRISILPT